MPCSAVTASASHDTGVTGFPAGMRSGFRILMRAAMPRRQGAWEANTLTEILCVEEKKETMIKALVFDFDGLILETEMPAFQAWQEIYREYDCELPLDEWVACVGGTVKDFDPCKYLETLCGRTIERGAVESRRRQRQLELVARQEALPGVKDYLTEARRLGLKVGLASNSSRAWVVGHLERLGLLEQFDCLKCGDEVSRQKPDPELYLAALKALGIAADQAIAFEDSPNGVRAARAAGIFSVAVPNVITQQLPLDHADLCLLSLASRPLTDVIAYAECQLKRRTAG